jgi:hypothetical protein
MSITDKLFRISLGLLLGIGGQYLMVGITTFRSLDFNGFNPFMWIMQVVYVVFIITLAIKED